MLAFADARWRATLARPVSCLHGHPSPLRKCCLNRQSALAQQHAILVAAVARAQDREAFAQLFDYYGPRLNAWLQRMKVERSLAEEVTQDVMVTLWRKASQFDPQKSSLATWLYRIARNRRIDLARRDRMDYRDSTDYALDLPDESLGNADDGLDAARREESLRLVLLDLPESQMQLIKLAFFDSLTHSEIAAQTGLPLGTVKSRLRLAFARLRRGLETQGVIEAI